MSLGNFFEEAGDLLKNEKVKESMSTIFGEGTMQEKAEELFHSFTGSNNETPANEAQEKSADNENKEGSETEA